MAEHKVARPLRVSRPYDNIMAYRGGFSDSEQPDLETKDEEQDMKEKTDSKGAQ